MVDAGAFDQLGGGDGLLDQVQNVADVLLQGAPDLLIFIRINECARSPSLENTSASNPSSTRPLITWTRGIPALHAATACTALETVSGAKFPSLRRHHLLQVRHQNLADELIAEGTAVGFGDKNQLGGLERRGSARATPSELTRYVFPSPSNPSGGSTGTIPSSQQLLQKLHIHLLHLAGELLIHPVDNPHGMGNDGVGADRAQVGRGKPLQDLMRQMIGGGQCQLKRPRIGNPACHPGSRRGRPVDPPS